MGVPSLPRPGPRNEGSRALGEQGAEVRPAEQMERTGAVVGRGVGAESSLGSGAPVEAGECAPRAGARGQAGRLTAIGSFVTAAVTV